MPFHLSRRSLFPLAALGKTALLRGPQLDAFQFSELDKWGKAVRAAGLAGTL